MYRLILAVSLLVSTGCCMGSQGVTVDDLQRIFAAMESSILDVTVEYEWYLDPPTTAAEIAGTSDLREVSHARETFVTARPFAERSLSSSILELADEHDNRFVSSSRQSYNGAVAKQFTNGGWPKPIQSGLVTKRTSFVPSWVLSPMGFTILRFYPDLLSEEMQKNNERFRVGEEVQKVNGFNAVSLDFLLENGNPYQRIYLSVDHSYAPVRFAYLLRDGRVNWTVEVLSLREVSAGIWFPVKGVIPSSNNVYEVKEVQLNKGLTKDYFDIEFHPGTRVVDEVAGVKYVIQAPGGHAVVAAAGGADAWPWWYYIGGGLLALTLVGCLAVVLKRRPHEQG